MKKLLSIILSLVMIASITACSSGQESKNEATSSVTQPATQASNLPVEKLEWVDFAEYSLEEDVPVTNIILMIGDGMGKEIIKGSEIVKGDKLVMSGMPHKTTVTTYSQSVTNGTDTYTDSAASATAISTGHKTINKYLGLDPDGNKLETICEYAKSLDMKTGLVARQVMSHATPAGMVAHNTSRDNYMQILREMINSGVDVMLGGGSQYIKGYPKNEKAVKAQNYNYITTPEELASYDKADEKLLGLFAYDNMGSASMSPMLNTMTAKALDLLENDKGFFLMVEGSNIDTYEHKSNMASTLEQMQGFDQAVDYALQWAEKHPGTLVIVTADHETGGVKIPDNAKPDDVNDSCFTSDGKHTNSDVALMASGAQSAGLCKEKLIDNTDIAKYMRKVLKDARK